VPVNLKDKDAFHLTIEEYLLALVSLIEELARLARNSVTLGDFRRPLQISQFIKDVHAGFQILNLKNDILRKRVDGIKYRVSLDRAISLLSTAGDTDTHSCLGQRGGRCGL
jgi:predicted translin family RNA/ssDNA-binding protein